MPLSILYIGVLSLARFPSVDPIYHHKKLVDILLVMYKYSELRLGLNKSGLNCGEFPNTDKENGLK